MKNIFSPTVVNAPCNGRLGHWQWLTIAMLLLAAGLAGYGGYSLVRKLL